MSESSTADLQAERLRSIQADWVQAVQRGWLAGAVGPIFWHEATVRPCGPGQSPSWKQPIKSKNGIYLAVGITNSAPLPMLSGQRCMMDFCLV